MPAMECKKENHLKKCNCSYEPCPRKGICCECIEYHLRQDELPACYFSVRTERTFDRSFRRFLQDQK
jgi:hypothetical protein